MNIDQIQELIQAINEVGRSISFVGFIIGITGSCIIFAIYSIENK